MNLTQMNLNEWLEYIRTLHREEIDLTLGRMTKMAEKLKLIHFDCPVIMIAGTNGKGTCIKSMEAIYCRAGYKVGCYTSPHLQKFNERICIFGQQVDDNTLCKVFKLIEKARGKEELTFFEFITLAAFHLFKQAPLDILLLEIGLGGRLDAVNVAEPDISIVTNIGLDHVDRLGDTREAIGFEKAGIFRSGKAAICGDPSPPKTLLDHAKNIGAQLFCVGEDYCPKLPKLHVDLDNATTALAAVEVLQDALPVSEENIHAALSQLQLPGRFEQINHSPPIILDVAHNPPSVARLVEKLKAKGWQELDIIVGMLSDKLIAESLQPLLPLVKNWYLIDLSEHPRGANHAQLEESLSCLGVKNWYNCASVAQAYEKALATQPENPLVVLGSFHTVAAAQRLLLP